MRAYRLSVNLKLGLIVFAVGIAVASLAYTNWLVERLRVREQAVIQLWADALAELPRAQVQSQNPYQAELRALEQYLAQLPAPPPDTPGRPSLEDFRQAVVWAQGMPAPAELNFVLKFIEQSFGIPAVVVDSSAGRPAMWRNVEGVPDPLDAFGLTGADSARVFDRLVRRTEDMMDEYAPIRIELGEAPFRQVQNVYYDESMLVKELRLFPYVQLLFVALFILVGYLGFSYVRRSEQSSLWVGMAKEAAHQLGTPISSLLGWIELMRMDELSHAQQLEAIDEVEKDVARLNRVASRFSDIGSLPKLDVMPLAPVIDSTADYIRRRMPQSKRVSLDVNVPADLRAPLNAELFEWVVENLLKNALDAIETNEGRIDVTARQEDGRLQIDVRDTGKGIDRRQWKNIFRPGFSTKKRGWGLGLSLAKRIVEDYHGGTLTLVQSRVGQGATFRIELPAAGGREEEE